MLPGASIFQPRFPNQILETRLIATTGLKALLSSSRAVLTLPRVGASLQKSCIHMKTLRDSALPQKAQERLRTPKLLCCGLRTARLYLSIYLSIYPYIHLSLPPTLCLSLSLSLYKYIYIHIMCIHIYIYIYTHTYGHLRAVSFGHVPDRLPPCQLTSQASLTTAGRPQWAPMAPQWRLKSLMGQRPSRFRKASGSDAGTSSR